MYETANQQQREKVLDLQLGEHRGWALDVPCGRHAYASVERVASVFADEAGFVFSMLN